MPVISTPGGVSICYDEFGSEHDPALLLIQGLGAQLLGWRAELCQLIADAGFRVIRFDNRDVGRSQKFPGGGYTIADLADDAAGLLTCVGISAAHIVGQSMGGLIAQHLALDHAARVRTLALVYTAPSVDRVAAGALLAALRKRPPVRTRAQAVAAYVTNEASCASPAYPQDIEWLRELGGLMYDRDRDADGILRQVAASQDSPDLTSRLPAIAVPTTIIHGDGDQLVAPAAAGVLHELIPGSTLSIHPGMGHELPRPLWPAIVAEIAANALRESATPPGSRDHAR